ncbi:sugar ABC transporter substrate-binding protein [Oleiharenicola lentus]|uniref:Sugar ABC transporter substrate-binding protein n=1 Tax=Oleiharenicola lentus TaxID=2508720 RepID=A0A4Q1C8C6_9BACT|nr:substrate-binding domain-containing protein [Oleiharenicola lentus]RXK55091.1 sugar ABC transporter substrate-binding protein [Oleiharenicola lentus]
MKRLLLLAASLAAALTGSAAERELIIGLVAKSQGNPVFQAARVGAEDAAKALSAKHKMKIKIDWRTPNEEDAQKQAEAIEQLVLAGAEGIAVSCSDANKLTDAINRAVDNGVPVATFDSDAPASKRFVTYGVDDIECGKQTMEELAKVMGGKGIVAILAGNQNAPNLQRRVQGAKEVAAKYPGITIRDTYYHKETPQDAAAKVEQVMQANPDITGWAMIGGWPLFTENALKWQPGTVACVSVDALPAQLAYIRSGHVPVLLAQQCYQWGYRSTELLIAKIVEKKNPPAVKEISALIPVTKDTVEEFAKNWDKWLPK